MRAGQAAPARRKLDRSCAIGRWRPEQPISSRFYASSLEMADLAHAISTIFGGRSDPRRHRAPSQLSDQRQPLPAARILLQDGIFSGRTVINSFAHSGCRQLNPRQMKTVQKVDSKQERVQKTGNTEGKHSIDNKNRHSSKPIILILSWCCCERLTDYLASLPSQRLACIASPLPPRIVSPVSQRQQAWRGRGSSWN